MTLAANTVEFQTDLSLPGGGSQTVALGADFGGFVPTDLRGMIRLLFLFFVVVTLLASFFSRALD